MVGRKVQLIKSIVFCAAVPPRSIHLRVTKETVDEGQNNDVVCSGAGAGPLSVNILLEVEPLVAGRDARFMCEVRGSNPPPSIKWFRNAKQLPLESSMIRHSGNISTSVLVLDIVEADHGTKLTCRAENPLLPAATLEDIYTLDVAYKPNVSLSLGWSLKSPELKEGNDAFFECRVDANPPPYKGLELEHNVREGILVSESTLALQRVNRKQSGAYQCKASNVEGDALSNPVNISIKCEFDEPNSHAIV
ncbi:hypothetical protein HAZT_HAZT005499 [Hyalella azteca]|uniref:Ig-like domain-containing protein n=1 Tax=Hyalella azteca TaxID=294128 RepID=A0A6A0H786_HYAAZ|nr:hypothetical protein HAZT_HAZT005499 [Hyalella azteca]